MSVSAFPGQPFEGSKAQDSEIATSLSGILRNQHLQAEILALSTRPSSVAEISGRMTAEVLLAVLREADMLKVDVLTSKDLGEAFSKVGRSAIESTREFHEQS